MRALDYLESVRSAARDESSVTKQLGCKTSSPVQSYREKALRRRIERDKELIEQCTTLLYGEVAERLTPRHADVLWLRYAEDRPWKQVASVLGCSVTSCHTWLNEALAVIDESHLIESI